MCVVLSSNTHNSGRRVHRLSNVHNLVTGPRGTNTRNKRVVRGPVLSGFGRKLSILRCFVSARNTHGNLTSATLGATSTKCLAHHLISISRSIVVGRRSYNALHKLIYASLGGGSRIVTALCRHVLNHMSIRSVVRPAANRLLISNKRRVARSVTGGVRRSPVRDIRVHSMLAYRSGGNMYTGYCKHGLTADHVIRGNRTINMVTTRSVNRPNARLALHAFRTNNATTGVTTGTDVMTGGTTHLRFRRLHAMSIISRANRTTGMMMNHLTRIHFISIGAGVILSARGMPCNSALCITSKRIIRGNGLVTG